MEKLMKLLLLLIVVTIVSCVPNDQVIMQPPNPEPTIVPAYTAAPDDNQNEIDTNLEPDESQWINEARRLTGDFSNFPSSDQVNDYINDATDPPNVPCRPAGRDQTTTPTSTAKNLHPAAIGARRLLASFYQSCKAIELPIDRATTPLKGVYSAKIVDGQKGVSGGRVRKITNNTAYVNSHRVLKELRNDPSYPAGPQCRDATQTPPVFGYGSRKIPSRNTGIVKIFSKGSGVARTSKSAAGIDCSSFISNALGAQGLKVSKTSGPFTSHTTRSFHAQANKANSCLKHARVTPDDAIRPGDMINVSSSHIVMVDSVGDDPLGIKKYSATGNCNGINPREFDFTYVHSGALRNSYGPSRVKANVHSGGTMWNNLRVMAIKLCQKKVAQDNAARDSRMIGMSTRFSLIRHQSSDPQCVSDKRIKIEGEDCINKCENVNKDIQSDT